MPRSGQDSLRRRRGARLSTLRLARRDELPELWQVVRPVSEDLRRFGRARRGVVSLDEAFELRLRRVATYLQVYVHVSRMCPRVKNVSTWHRRSSPRTCRCMCDGVRVIRASE